MKEKSNERKNNIKLKAFLVTFLSIVGVLLVLILWKKEKYVLYYTKHSLVIFVVGAVAGVAGAIAKIIPIIGGIINFALAVIVIILWIISWVYALSGKIKEIPIVSEYAKKIDL